VDTRERILAVTTELLARDGLERTSTRAICAAAGVTAPTLYHHFGTKDALFEAVVADGFERYIEGKLEAISGEDAVERLGNGFDQYVSFALSNPSLYSVVFDRANSERLPKAAEEAYGMLLALLEDVERERGLRVPVELAAQLVWSAAHGVASLLISRPGFGWDGSLAATAREMAVEAVLAPEEGGREEARRIEREETEL
jgi:AcrR family transcriptional regulator